jgi:hypothetical protein
MSDPMTKMLALVARPKWTEQSSAQLTELLAQYEVELADQAVWIRQCRGQNGVHDGPETQQILAVDLFLAIAETKDHDSAKLTMTEFALNHQIILNPKSWSPKMVHEWLAVYG